MKHFSSLKTLVALNLLITSPVESAEEGFVRLGCDTPTFSWQAAEGEANCRQWTSVFDVVLDSENATGLIAQAGKGVLVSTLQGRADHRNLISKQLYGDIDIQLDFLVARDSNGGVKLQGLYEIQIRDTHGIAHPDANDCGGIYPRAQLRPYRLIDKGIPPLTNAAKPAGQWQTLFIQFQAPRFDSDGKKIVNAKLIKVVLNEKTIHENVDLKWPTGHYWNQKEEVAKGPLFLQGDHGPIAYRNVRIRPLPIGDE